MTERERKARLEHDAALVLLHDARRDWWAVILEGHADALRDFGAP